MALPQMEGGKPDSWSIEMMPSSIVLLALSATPFCWGLFRTVCCLWMPWSVQNASNSLDMYSPPLSSRKEPILWPVTFSAQALNCLNEAKVSDLRFKRYTPLKRGKSSMKDWTWQSWGLEQPSQPWSFIALACPHQHQQQKWAHYQLCP